MNETIIWIIAIIVGLFLLFALFVVVSGLRSPVEHSVARRIQLKQSAEELWNTINDHEKETEWQPHLEYCKRLPDIDGKPAWQLKLKGSGNPPMTLITTVSEPPYKLVGTISDQKKVFDGRWIFELKPVHGATELTLTETAKINNPVFRGLYHLFGDPAMYLDQYLKALAAKYNETVTISGL